ncbi:MAG: DUF456 domain-containing protein [Bacteroidota bacterium]
MEIVIYIIAGIFMLVGILGCFLPIIPGPPISYVGLLLLQLKEIPPFTQQFMIIWLIITALVFALDYIVPVLGAKKYGGTSKGVIGSAIGLILGIFLFPPIGIILGPIIGAFIGEVVAGKDSKNAMKAAYGSFIGFLFGTGLKLIASGFMFFYYLQSLF